MLDQNLDTFIEKFEAYKQVREKVLFPAKSHDKIMEKLVNKLENKYELDLLDGIKIKINDDSWALVRKSNTEDIIRISGESNDKEKCISIINETTKMVKENYDKIR